MVAAIGKLRASFGEHATAAETERLLINAIFWRRIGTEASNREGIRNDQLSPELPVCRRCHCPMARLLGTQPTPHFVPLECGEPGMRGRS